MTALKLRSIGNSVGLVLPVEVLARMQATTGDMLHLTEVPGGIKLSSYDPVFEEQMAIARRIMKENTHVLRELAKSLTEPRWLSKAVVIALHGVQLAEHGGLDGLRDEDLLDSASGRPQNKFAYGDRCDLFELAAAYAYGMVKNHPIMDGNKRTSLVAALTFLLLNGFAITSPEAARLPIWLALAHGSLSETALADWLRAHATTEP